MELPANNVSQKLYNTLLPNCQKENPAACCTRDNVLQNFYKKSPKNLWNTASNYQGGPGYSLCNDNTLARQCFLSQYYNYLSRNNTLN